MTTYNRIVPSAAHSLLVLLAILGLAVPKATAHLHDDNCESADTCQSADTCSAPIAIECPDAEPSHGCPPPDQCPCDHPEEHHHHPPQPLQDQDSQDDDSAPAPKHHHHHHHQCVCFAAGGWLISDADPIALHPPRLGGSLAIRECFNTPDSPVFLFDRPPIA